MATITDQSDALARTLKHVEVKKGHSDSRLVIAQHKYQVRRAPVTASKQTTILVNLNMFSIVLHFFILSHSLISSLPINSVICPIFFQ